MANDIPKQYRVDENGDIQDFRPTLLKAAFAGVAILYYFSYRSRKVMKGNI